MLKSFPGAASVSNYRPIVAKALIARYSQEGGLVVDFSAGYGGRLLAALALNRPYLGDLHTRQQAIAMLDTETGGGGREDLTHEAGQVQEFYSSLPGPVLDGHRSERIDALVSTVDRNSLGINCQVGRPAKIRAAEPRKKAS